MKADWNGYSAELDELIEDVEPIPANYKCFVVYVYHLEDKYQEDAAQDTFSVLLTNQRLYMKYIRSSIQATHLTMVP